MLLRKSLRTLGVRLGTTLGAATAAASIAACSSSSSPPAASSPSPPIPTSSCTDAGLAVAFNPMYSAFDGTHTFQVPALVVGSSGKVTWTADGSMVRLETDVERPNEVLITMRQAGNVLINVQSSDGKCGSSLLSITPAQESDWEIGRARYNNGMSLHLTGAASGTGSPLEQQGIGGPACTSCHGETATNGPFTDVSHTPEQTGGFSDEDLINIIENGEFPDGGYFDPSIVLYPAWHNFHRWTDITEDQQRGIVAYLRSLTPAPQKGAVNFGAFDVDSGSGGSDTDGGVEGDDASAADATVGADGASSADSAQADVTLE